MISSPRSDENTMPTCGAASFVALGRAVQLRCLARADLRTVGSLMGAGKTTVLRNPEHGCLAGRTGGRPRSAVCDVVTQSSQVRPTGSASCQPIRAVYGPHGPPGEMVRVLRPGCNGHCPPSRLAGRGWKHLFRAIADETEQSADLLGAKMVDRAMKQKVSIAGAIVS